MLIIDDNRLMREGLSALLNAQPDVQVVGAVADLAAALGQMPEVTPHVVLVDAGLGSCTIRGRWLWTAKAACTS